MRVSPQISSLVFVIEVYSLLPMVCGSKFSSSGVVTLPGCRNYNARV